MKKNKAWEYVSAHGLLFIIVLAFVYRMLFFISLQPWNPDIVEDKVITGDALEYHPLALSIMSNKSFEDFTTLRTPGYPLFVAFIYSISCSRIWMVLLVQIMLSMVSLFLVYKTTSLFLSQRIALLAALLFAFDTTQAIWTVELYTETLFVLLFLASMYFLSTHIQKTKFIYLSLSALLLGLATLVKPVSFIFPAVAITVILLIKEMKIGWKLIQGLVYLLVFLITISPWLLHNFSKHGEAKLSSISGFNLLLYNVAYTEVSITGKPIDDVRKDWHIKAAQQGADTTNIHSFENSEIYNTLAKEYIRDNLFPYLKRHLMGTINMYAGLGTQKVSALLDLKTESKDSDPFASPGLVKRIMNFIHEKTLAILVIAFFLGIFLLVNYLFSIYGVFVLWKKKEIILILFLLIILYFSALTGVVGYDRYRIPFMPFVNILSATGLVALYDKFIGRSVKK